MDELELLKKDWQKDGVKDKQFTSKDLSPMLLKKSSSIVKTLFYISIAELVFWILLNFLPMLSNTYMDEVHKIYGDSYALPIITTITFSIILLFIYLLYKSYKTISATDNAKKLMESILKTRKVIKYYVLYNLIMIALSIPVSLYFNFKLDPELSKTINEFSNTQMIGLVAFTLLVTGILVLLFWLFYKLLYGILLKRLNRNYKELKKLEV